MRRLSFIPLLAALTMAGLVSCSEPTDSNSGDLKYLAVQMDDDENWSIIDGEGKVVVDGEYAPGNEISAITENGVYWVKQNGKFQLFSVKSPGKPLNDAEFDAVTQFGSGHACVSILGEPIQIINDKGKIVAALSKEIASAEEFHDGLARVLNSEGEKGFVNTSGDIVIKPEYKFASVFSEGLCFVQKEWEKDIDVIDKKGNVQFSLKDSKYHTPWDAKFTEGLVILQTKGDDSKPEILNAKGEVVARLKKKYYDIFGFKDGYASVYITTVDMDGVHDENLVIDKNGDPVFRTGKYRAAVNISGGMFLVEKNKRMGVVDKDDNVVVDFDYDYGIFAYTLGGNFILRQGSTYAVVKKNGEEIKKLGFSAISEFSSPDVTFVDVKSLAEEITSKISTKGYDPFDGMVYPYQFGEKFKLKPEEYNQINSIVLPSFQAGINEVEVMANFASNVSEMMTHTNTVSDGWFEHEETVEDGIDWATTNLTSVELSSRVDKAGLDGAYELVKKHLKAKGFEEEDPYSRDDETLRFREGDLETTIRLGKSDGKLFIWIYPQKDISEV